MTDIAKLASAAHEAGHVAAAIAYGIPVSRVSIDNPDPHRPGITELEPPPRGLRAAERFSVVLLAGREAERLYYAEPLPPGSDTEDLVRVREVLLDGRSFYAEQSDDVFVTRESLLPEHIERLRRRAARLVRQPVTRWRIEVIRIHLIASGTLDAAAIKEVLSAP